MAGVAELSRRAGVPVPTTKYYLREGLLPQGELTSRNQAQYDDLHLRRLRLIRALTDLGHVPLAGVRTVLQALDSDAMSLHERIGHAHRAVTPPRQLTAARSGADDALDTARAAAQTQVAELLERRGWSIEPDAPALTTLADTIAVLRSLGQHHLLGLLDAYADTAERLAALEVAAVTADPGADQIAEAVVIGTILGEPMLAALRLLAQEDASSRQLTATATDGSD